MVLSSAVLIGWTAMGVCSALFAGLPRGDRRRWLPTAAVFGPLFLAVAVEQRDQVNAVADDLEVDLIAPSDVPLWQFDDDYVSQSLRG